MNPYKKIAVQLFVSLAIVGLLVLGILFFGFQISKFSKKITTTRQELAERSVSLESLASLRSDYINKGEAYLNVIYNIVPQKDELIDLSKDLEVIAREDKLDYGFTFLGETSASAGSLGSVRFNVSLGGELRSLLNFIKNLQNFRYLLSIDNLSLSRGISDMKMDIKGNVFFRQ